MTPQSTATPDRPPRLVTVTHFFPAHGGGLEGVAGRLVQEFAQRGVAITWFSSGTDPAPADIGQQVTHVSVPTSNIVEQLTQLPYPLWSPAILSRLWRAIGDADVVHVHEHLYAPSIAALFLARLRGKPVVITQHMGALGLPNRMLTAAYECGAKLLGWMLFPLAARRVFISANVRRFFGRENDQDSPLIFNGVDTGIFNPGVQDRADLRRKMELPIDQKIALFVGRLVRKKGLHIVRQLAGQRPDMCWMIVGSGPEDPAAWNLKNVRVIGRVDHDNLADYYRAADLLILPSSGEGFPLVVQEALCCGTRVLSTEEVASACPPAAQMIMTCPTPRTDSNVEGWLAALDRALPVNNTQLDRRRDSDAAQTLWSWSGTAERYLALFRQIG